MVEFFKLIASKPLEFIAGLGVSSATIYSMVMIIKFVLSLITKKKNFQKENLKFNKLADLVINKFGGVEEFINKISVQVISNLAPTFNEFNKKFNEILLKETCPLELKAYIETVLKANGNKELLLTYEDLKRKLSSELMQTKKEFIQNIKQIEQEIKSEIEQVRTDLEIKEITSKSKEIKETKDITYV